MSATSEAAGKIELREGDTPVKEIIVASFGSAELKPGGPHVMLMDLKRPLKAGETIEIVLATDSGIILKVPAPVKMIVSPL